MKEFFKKVRENLTFRDILPGLGLLAAFALGVVGLIVWTFPRFFH